MKNACIIAEFNPFHKGHKYLIDTVKSLGATHITAIMSGNFVQRGECAVFSKYDRAIEAVKNGVDLVIELPTPFAVSSAGYFARAGVKIACKTGCADILCFGSECGSAEEISEVADAMSDENVNQKIKEYCAQGNSYPNSVSEALKDISFDGNVDIVNNPNDTLALEYIKALKDFNSNIVPVAVKRTGALHGDMNDCNYSSTALREKIINGEISTDYRVHQMKNLEKIIFAKLLSMSEPELFLVPDVEEGLENRIFDAVRKSTSLEELYMNIKTKRYTHSRIRRIVISSLLDLKKYDLKEDIPYINILAFNDKGKDILRSMRDSCELPVIMKYSEINKKDRVSSLFSEIECFANDIFELAGDNIIPGGTQQKTSSIYVKESI